MARSPEASSKILPFRPKVPASRGPDDAEPRGRIAMIVIRDVGLRFALRRTLRAKGYDVLAAQSVRQARALLAFRCPSLMVVDDPSERRGMGRLLEAVRMLAPKCQSFVLRNGASEPRLDSANSAPVPPAAQGFVHPELLGWGIAV